MAELHADLIEKHIVATVEKTVAECIAEIDSLPIVNHNGTPMEEVVHHLMVLKCNIRERFKIRAKQPDARKQCAQKFDDCHYLFCQYPECEKLNDE